jgi:hypothetical protein
MKPLLILGGFRLGLAISDRLCADAKTKLNRSKIPSLDISPICRAAKRKDADACYRKEWAAQDSLVKRWAESLAGDRAHCIEKIEQAVVPTYQSLLKCLDEITRPQYPMRCGSVELNRRLFFSDRRLRLHLARRCQDVGGTNPDNFNFSRGAKSHHSNAIG